GSNKAAPYRDDWLGAEGWGDFWYSGGVLDYTPLASWIDRNNSHGILDFEHDPGDPGSDGIKTALITDGTSNTFILGEHSAPGGKEWVLGKALSDLNDEQSTNGTGYLMGPSWTDWQW